MILIMPSGPFPVLIFIFSNGPSYLLGVGRSHYYVFSFLYGNVECCPVTDLRNKLRVRAEKKRVCFHLHVSFDGFWCGRSSLFFQNKCAENGLQVTLNLHIVFVSTREKWNTIEWKRVEWSWLSYLLCFHYVTCRTHTHTHWICWTNDVSLARHKFW